MGRKKLTELKEERQDERAEKKEERQEAIKHVSGLWKKTKATIMPPKGYREQG